MIRFSYNCQLYQLLNRMYMVAVWDVTSFWQFDIIFCSVLDNHESVEQVMSI